MTDNDEVLHSGNNKILKSFKDLKVWQKAYALCLDAYKASHAFPLDERYGLTSQIRRAAVSIPSNIAEGYGRKTKPDYIRCLHIAYGSVCELETQMLLSRDLGYMNGNNADAFENQLREVERMLKGLIKALEKSLTP